MPRGAVSWRALRHGERWLFPVGLKPAGPMGPLPSRPAPTSCRGDGLPSEGRLLASVTPWRARASVSSFPQGFFPRSGEGPLPSEGGASAPLRAVPARHPQWNGRSPPIAKLCLILGRRCLGRSPPPELTCPFGRPARAGARPFRLTRNSPRRSSRVGVLGGEAREGRRGLRWRLANVVRTLPQASLPQVALACLRRACAGRLRPIALRCAAAASIWAIALRRRSG